MSKLKYNKTDHKTQFMDRQTNMTQIKVAFRNFANASQKTVTPQKKWAIAVSPFISFSKAPDCYTGH